MNRQELERKLLEDAELRKYLDDLRHLAQGLDEAEAESAKVRQRLQEITETIAAHRSELHSRIRDLAVDRGVPKATLARLVGLSPQRINSIVAEQEGRSPTRGLLEDLAGAKKSEPPSAAQPKRKRAVR